MSLSLDEVVRMIPEWRDRPVRADPVPGGLTNTNFRVEVDGTAYLVRIPGAQTELLAIDRANEVHNARAAADAGVSPRLIHHLAEHDVTVFEFIAGRTMSLESLHAPEMPGRIAAAVRRLHTARRFLVDFDMFRLAEQYRKTAEARGVPIPPGYRDRRPTVARMEAALSRRPRPAVPCHNDLLAENFVDDGAHLWLVDFEYSGNNDACFELGNTCQELQYSEAQYAELCAGYFGAAEPSLLARMHLWAVMSDVGWTLWGAIQATISRLEFDFWGYALQRWERALRALDTAEFPRWLEEVNVR